MIARRLPAGTRRRRHRSHRATECLTSVILMMPRILRRNSLRLVAASHSVRGVLAVNTPGVALSVSRMLQHGRIVGEVDRAALAHRHRPAGLEVDRHRADELMHDRRNPHARLDIAVLIERSGRGGARLVTKGSCSLSILPCHAVDQLRQVQPRRGLHRPKHEPTDQESDGLAGPVLEFAVVGRKTGQRRRLVFQAGRSGRQKNLSEQGCGSRAEDVCMKISFRIKR